MSSLIVVVGWWSGRFQKRSVLYFVERPDRHGLANLNRFFRLFIVGRNWNRFRDRLRIRRHWFRFFYFHRFFNLGFFRLDRWFDIWPGRIVRIFVGQERWRFYNHRRDI